MTDTQQGFVATIKSYPGTFWVANTMEIFERMAWYGFFAVSSLYITGPVETGGLGFTSEERGQLQAIVPFFLYIMPVITGALADRYGYKKMFILAYTCMILFYYGLGQFKTFPTFLGAFMLVAVAAAIFKPVVVGTVARVTDERNSSMGFGIFYMMVNIGGFAGPLVAGAIRGISWNYVFIACSAWAAVNLMIVILFYRDPTTEAGSKGARTLRKVLDDTVEVLGNLRFFITVFVVLIALMVANQELEHFKFWPHCTVFIVAWLVLNFVWDAFMPLDSGRPVSRGAIRRNPFLKRMHCSNWRFALFLLIMSGFWTSFNQIFLTMPEYIRDYADTKPMVNIGRRLSPSLSGLARSVVDGLGFEETADKIGPDAFLDALAAIEETELLAEFDKMIRRAKGVDSMVPPPAPTAEGNEKAKKKVLETLRKLREDEELSEEDRAKVEEMIALLTPKKATEAEAAPTTQTAETQPSAAQSETKADILSELRRLQGRGDLDEVDRARVESMIATLEREDSGDVKSADALTREIRALGAARELIAALRGEAPVENDEARAVVQQSRKLLKLFDDHSDIEAAEELVKSIERAEQIEKFPEEPSLTDEDRETLTRLVRSINKPGVEKPLEAIDLVEGAKRFLKYKVRVQATELGELLAGIPASLTDVSDEDLDTAVRTVNKKLDSTGKAEFENSDAERLKEVLRNLLVAHGPLVPRGEVVALCDRISTDQRKVEPSVLALGIRDLAYRPVIWDRMDAGRQVNPEHIVNIDALSIVLLQVLISFLMAKFHRFTTMIVGMVIAAVGIGLSAVAGGTMIGPLGGMLIVVIVGIVTFAIGEMMASPTSQEYVGRIAPRDKVALYMGYYFVAVALGNLFGGILSGQLYGKLARDMQRPDLMWLAFGGIMLGTAIVFVLYNRFALPKHKADTLTPSR